MFTSAGSGSVDSTTSQSIACSRPFVGVRRRDGPRSPSRSRRTAGVLRQMLLPAARTAAAMFSYSRLMPCRGYMYFVK